MHKRSIGVALALGLAFAGVAATGASERWLDVLDAPAVQSPLAAKGLINGLATAGTRVVAVGQRGHILWSQDAGAHWQQAQVPVSSDLVAVHFPTPKQGWAVGHDGVVLHTEDGGEHWKRQRDGRPDDAETPLLDVWFANEHEGYAVGAFGTLLHTTDAGATWTSMRDASDNPKGMHLYTVRGIGDDIYIAGEQGMMLKFDRASGRFRAIEQPYKGTLFGVTGVGQTVVAHGLRGNVVRSTDAGATWQPVATGVNVGLTGSTTDAQGRILIASQAGHLLESRDGGASFTPMKVDRPAPAAAVLVSGTNLIVAGPRGLQTLALP
jgi:YD repeat-containing protein